MNFNNKKECLNHFKNRCEHFKSILNQSAILAINFDDYDFNRDEILDNNTSEWKNFISDINGYFRVNKGDVYEKEINTILSREMTLKNLEELQHAFHDISVNIDIERANREKDLLVNSQDDYEDMDNNEVFIVHGHDDSLKYEVARFIDSQKLTSIILHEQASSGRTIIEKIEKYTNVGFAIVLYTPDDLSKNKDDSGEYKYRARQNVILEHGYLMGKLGRERVCAIVKGDIEKPSDIDGVVYVEYDMNNGWKFKLANEMRSVGYKISL